MASRSRLALTLLLLGGSAAASLAACGGDDDNGTPSTQNDAGSGSNASDAAAADAGPAHASAGSLTIYYGATAKLDGTASTGPAGFTYAWSIASGPNGTASTLTDANTATPSFTPDRAGVYTLTLQVAGGGITSTIQVTVTVVDPPVFYLHTESDGGPSQLAAINVVGAVFGKGGSEVACSVTDAGTAQNNNLVDYVSRFGSDAWEGPAGTPSRVVYAYRTVSSTGAVGTTLATTTSAASCANTPTALDTATGEPTSTRPFEQPRFSPSGNRIAYVKNAPSGSVVTTVGFDGSSPRSLAPFYVYPDGGANATRVTGTSEQTRRPVWINETTVAWIELIDGNGWQVVSASDAANATPTLLMKCTGNVPSEMDVLPSGEIITSQLIPVDAGMSTNIVAYMPDAATKSCGAPRNLSKVTESGAVAYDFSLSPDKTRVAYVSSRPSGNALVIAAVDGSGAVTQPLSGSGTTPRWVGEGRYISFTSTEAAFVDGGSTLAAVAVMQSNAQGVHAAAIAATNQDVNAGIGNGYSAICSMGRAYGPGTMLFGLMGIVGLRFVRRRKKD